MRALRAKLTYADVMSSIAVFLVVAGGTAFAAQQLAKNSVGARQLKRSAVTAAKIKKNAVTAAKIRKGAVTGAKLRNGAVNAAKIADGAIGGAKINTATVPFGRTVHGARGNASIPVGDDAVVYPLTNTSYVQEGERSDIYLGAVDLTFQPSCEPPRYAYAGVLIDPPPNIAGDEYDYAVSLGRVFDDSAGTVTRRIEIGPYVGGVRFRPGQPTNRNIVLMVRADCKGETTGATATSGAVDVIGIK